MAEMIRRVPPNGLFRDAASYLVSKAIPGLAGLVSVAVFIRMMGREQYGKYALASTIANTASLFCLGWLSQALLRYRSQLRDEAATRRGIRTGLRCSLLAGMLGLIAVFQIPSLSEAYSATGLLSVMALFAGLSVFLIRSALFQADLQPTAIVRMGATQAVLGLSLPVVLFVALDPRYYLALAGLALSYLAPALWGGSWLTWRSGSARMASQAVAKPVLGDFWRYGWALSLWMAVTALLQVSDRHFIQVFFGFDAAGSYAATYDLVFRGFTLALAPVTLAIHPRMMQHWNAGRTAEAWSIWRWGLGVQAGIFAIVIVPALWVREVVVWIVGADATQVRQLVMPLLAGGFLWQLCMLAHKPLEVASRTSSMLWAALVALAVNVGANVFLLPRLGVAVTAYATVVSSLSYMIVVLVLGARAHRSAMPA